ncbi:peptidase domain-containing ABC transporter [Pseudomonas poae]|uniref:peptidase domain-containing ABC transporter n=1 Tax=Pseudomonas TaxID=286 RepID=UPI000812B7C6|nr:peptidase domain-containing ABC transporter [Pseudomonas sp. 25 E 4]CRM12345.1 Lactococcin-G-processing and transport ATP-binding protein LagD [Pseudomonas sp. 25 E 4]
MNLFKKTIPIIMQVEATECGLACLAMVASYYGNVQSLQTLRNSTTSSLKGVSLSSLIKISSTLGLKARPLKVGLKQLNKLTTPCILHWGLNHYVVLAQVTRSHIVILDPAIGRRKLIIEEASNFITGIVLELTPDSSFSPVNDRKPLSVRDAMRNIPGINSALVQLLFLALILEVFTIAGPFYLQLIVDQVLVSKDKSLLTVLGVGFSSLIIFQTITSASRAWSIATIGRKLNIIWTDKIFRHMLKLPLEWFERRYVGDVVSRFSSVRNIQDTLTSQFIGVLLDGVMSLFTVLILCFFSMKLLSLTAATFFLYALLRWAFIRPMFVVNGDFITSYAKQYGDLVESTRGALTIKLNNNQPIRAARFSNLVTDVANKEFKKHIIDNGFEVFKNLLFPLSKIFTLWIAAYMVMANNITIGAMIAIIAYTDILTLRGTAFIDKIIDLKMLNVHIERVSDIALAKIDSNTYGLIDPQTLSPCIEVNNVSYRYSDDEPWILKNLSLRIEAGESVAISGNSGGGKTTLAKLILGLIESSEGKIFFGGIPLHTIGVERYREIVGSVMQGDQLFAGSIADNISFFTSDASIEDIIDAAKAADIHEDVIKMPLGYFTPVGDMGSALSGGQKQRIILARALFRKPKLLILDEATSHLDTDSEYRVNEAIKKLNITRIIIAHRIETIASASRAITLKDGAFLDSVRNQSTPI